jgi:hypothetical protein
VMPRVMSAARARLTPLETSSKSAENQRMGLGVRSWNS